MVVDAVAVRVRVRLAGIRSPRRPIGVSVLVVSIGAFPLVSPVCRSVFVPHAIVRRRELAAMMGAPCLCVMDGIICRRR